MIIITFEGDDVSDRSQRERESTSGRQPYKRVL